MRIQSFLSLAFACQFGFSTLLAQEPAVAPLPVEPVVSPTPAPTAPDPVVQPVSNKDLELKALLDLYVRDQISAGVYQRRRAEILGRTRQANDDPWDRASVKSSNTGKPAPAAVAVPASTPPPAEPTPTTPTGLVKAVGATAIATAMAAAPSATDAAIVPGADLYLQADLMTARQTPIYATIAKLMAKKPNQDSATAGVMKQKEMFEAFEQRLGLKEEDIERIVFSVDLDKVQLGGDQTSLDSAAGVAAIQLSKEVTLAQIKEAIAASTQEKPPTLTDAKVGPVDVLVVKSQEPKDPEVHLAVLGGKTILAGLNRTSLSSALTRASGAPSQLSGMLAATQRPIAPGSQFKLGFVVPQSFKDQIQGMAAGANGGAGGGGPAAMLAGLKDMKSISLGLALAEGATVQITGDMGQAQAAEGVNTLVQMMKPQLVASLAEQSGQDATALGNMVTSRTSGSKVDISLAFSKQILEALAAKE